MFSLIQGDSKFYILKNNAVLPKATGGSHWLTYHPGYMYCFLPSFEADKGTVHVFDHLPDFLRDFLFCSEILDISMSDVTKSGIIIN